MLLSKFPSWCACVLGCVLSISYSNPAGFQLQDPGDGNPFWLDATRHLKGGTHAELVILKGFWVNWDSLNWSANLTFGLGCLYLGDEVSVFFCGSFHGWPYKWKLHTYTGSPWVLKNKCRWTGGTAATKRFTPLLRDNCEIYELPSAARKKSIVWFIEMDISKNSGTPQIIHFNRVFHY